MIRIYRMWRFIRMVERDILYHKKGARNLTNLEYGNRFTKLKTVFRCNYTAIEAVITAYTPFEETIYQMTSCLLVKSNKSGTWPVV